MLPAQSRHPIAVFGILLLGSVTAAAAEADLKIPQLVLTSVDGQLRRLGPSEAAPIEALVFMSPECPISCQYVPELNRLHERYAPSGVRFAGVISDPSITRSRSKGFAEEFQLQFPLLVDASALLADICQPTHVPEVFVFHQGQLVYRGRIDDTYPMAGKRRREPTTRDLVAILDSLVAGKEVAFHRTAAVGCRFEPRRQSSSDAKVTYNRDIAPILNAHCANCHREGEVAPFTLASYNDAAKRAQWISEVIESRAMPPWQAKPGHGQFIGERRLSDAEIALVKAWVDAGTPEGNPEDLPPLPTFVSGWQLGTPDLIVQVPETYEVAADGPDQFRNFAVKLDLKQRVHIKAIEFRPGNPRVVHHGITMCDPTGQSLERDASDPQPGYPSQATGVEELVRGAQFLELWAPGVAARPFPQGVALPVDPGSAIVLNVHYHPSGKPESDRSMVGIYLAKESEPITHPVFVELPVTVSTGDIDIPAGAKEHHLAADFTLPTDIKLLAVYPHMHFLGTEIKVRALRPDGQEESLVWIDRWNFNWQDKFVYASPLELPKGTRLDLEAWYDNSADNPHNPSNPPKRVLLGEQSTDEMCLAFLQVAIASEEDAEKLRQGLLQSAFKMITNAKMDPEFRRRVLPEIMKVISSGAKKSRQAK